MAQNAKNIGPIGMSMLLHAMLVAAMLATFGWPSPAPITPMVIQATLVPDSSIVAAPPVVEKDPEPEPEPEVVIPEPEPEPEVELPEPEPEPDNSAELRRAAEEEKRAQDALVEKQRLEKIREQELAERVRKEKEAAERKKADDERKERERQEAERKREEDIKRQREENERLRRELESDARAQEIEDEERVQAARNSPAAAAYYTAISQKVGRNWAMPASANADTKCIATVRQLVGGDVVSVTIKSCNGGEAVRRSAEAAVHKSSPLPQPPDPDMFVAVFDLVMVPQQ